MLGLGLASPQQMWISKGEYELFESVEPTAATTTTTPHDVAVGLSSQSVRHLWGLTGEAERQPEPCTER